MKFYDFPVAPSPRKVRIFIAEKGLNITTTLINLREGDQSSKMFRAVNPRGTVPALELDDGTCLTESLAICHYLERFQPEPNLLGIDAKEQALTSIGEHDSISNISCFYVFSPSLHRACTPRCHMI